MDACCDNVLLAVRLMRPLSSAFVTTFSLVSGEIDEIRLVSGEIDTYVLVSVRLMRQRPRRQMKRTVENDVM